MTSLDKFFASRQTKDIGVRVIGFISAPVEALAEHVLDENLKSRKSKRCKLCSSKPQKMNSRVFGRLKVIGLAPSKTYICSDSPDKNGSIPAWFGPISAPATIKKGSSYQAITSIIKAPNPADTCVVRL